MEERESEQRRRPGSRKEDESRLCPGQEHRWRDFSRTKGLRGRVPGDPKGMQTEGGRSCSHRSPFPTVALSPEPKPAARPLSQGQDTADPPFLKLSHLSPRAHAYLE